MPDDKHEVDLDEVMARFATGEMTFFRSDVAVLLDHISRLEEELYSSPVRVMH